MLKINGRPVRNLQRWQAALSAKVGRVTLAMIPIESKDMVTQHVSPQNKGQPSRIRKARDLFSKVRGF